MAGSFLAARPCTEISTMRATVRAPSEAMHRSTARALAAVSARSDA